MITGILSAAALIGGVGIFVGLFLGAAGVCFSVKVNKKEEAVLAALPGNNCGGCGHAGCAALAGAIVSGDAAVNACPVGGEAVAEKIAEIMGVESGESVRKAAFVHCMGSCGKTRKDYAYTGVEDCAMIAFVPGGGPKSCKYGCTGYGNCVKACPFDAIHIRDGIAEVDREACRACGKCVEACPKHLITLEPWQAKHLVACSSADKGAVTVKLCDAGCIGCGICVKNCPSGAVEVKDFHAVIDREKCTDCGICAEKCPKHVIL